MTLSQTQTQVPTDPNLLLPRTNTARPSDFVVLHNIAAHASDPKYHPTALTTAKLLLYRAFGAQWTPAQDRKQFLTLGYEQLDAFASGFQDLYRLKQEHQDQLMRQQTDIHITVVDRYRTELKKLQDRCKRAEADKFELRQKYDFLKKQAGDARMLGAVLLAGGGSADQIRESEEQREEIAQKDGRENRRARGPFQPSPSPSMQEEDSESRRTSSQQHQTVVLPKPAFGSRTYGVAKPSSNVREATPPKSPPLPLPSFTYTDDNNDGTSIRTTSQFPRRRISDGERPSSIVDEQNSLSTDDNESTGQHQRQTDENDPFAAIEQFDDPNEFYLVESQQNFPAASRMDKSTLAAATPRAVVSSSSPRGRMQTAAAENNSAQQHLQLPSRQHQQQHPPTFTNKVSINDDSFSIEERKREQSKQHKLLALKALTIGHSPSHVRDLLLAALPETGESAIARVLPHIPNEDERTKISRVYKVFVSQFLSYMGRLGEGKPTLRSLEATKQAFNALRLAEQVPLAVARGRIGLRSEAIHEIIVTLIGEGNVIQDAPTFIRNIIDDALATSDQQELAKVIVINAVYGGNARAQLDKISDALDIGVEKQHLLDTLLQKIKAQLPELNASNFFKCLQISNSRFQLDSIMTQAKLASPSDMARFWRMCETFDGLIQAINQIFQANCSKSLKRILLEISVLFNTNPDTGVLLVEQQAQLMSSPSDQNAKSTNEFSQVAIDLLKSDNETNKIKRTVFRAIATGDDLPEIFAMLNAENVVLTDARVEEAFVDAGLLLLTVEERENLRLSKKKAKRPKPSDEEMGQNELFLKNVIVNHGSLSNLTASQKQIVHLSEILTAVACVGNVEDAVGLLHAMSANSPSTSLLQSSGFKAQLLQLLMANDQSYSTNEIFGIFKAICVSDSLPQLRTVIDLFQPQQLKRSQIDAILQRLGILPSGGSLSNTHEFSIEQQEKFVLVAIMKSKEKMPFLRRALIVLAVCDDSEQMQNVLSELSLSDDAKQTGAEHFECMVDFATAVDEDNEDELAGAAAGTVVALGISCDPANVLSILTHKTGFVYNSSAMLTALYLLKLFGCGSENLSRLLTDSSVANRIACASHNIVAAAAAPNKSNNASHVGAAKTEINAHDITEMLVLAKSAEQAVEILQELDNNQHILHISNTIDLTRLQQTIQFGRNTALGTCQALALSSSSNLANLLPIMDCLGVDRNDFMINETFDALGYGLLSLTPQKIQQQQQKLRQQSVTAGAAGESGRRVGSALLQLNRKRRADAFTERASTTGPNSSRSTSSAVAERLAQQQQQQAKKHSPPPSVAAAATAEKDARKSKTLSTASSRPTTASIPSRKSTPDAQLSSSSTFNENELQQQKSSIDENRNLSVSPDTVEEQQKRPPSVELNSAFDREFEAFNETLDGSPSKSALLGEQKKNLNLEPNFRVTNQVHIMARQHQRNPKTIGNTEWESLKVQVEDLEHQLFEQTNLEQSQQQQIRC